MVDLANLLQQHAQLKRPDFTNEAKRLYEEVIRGYEKTQGQGQGQGQEQGQERVEFQTTANNASSLLPLTAIDTFDKAQYQGQGQEQEDQSQNQDHPLYAFNAMGNLAILLTDEGNYHQALVLYEQALHGKEQSLGAFHESTLTTMNNMGVLLKKLGRYEEVTHPIDTLLGPTVIHFDTPFHAPYLLTDSVPIK